MSAELTVACLGAGYFAQFHHDAWKRIPEARLIAVTDHDEARAPGSSAYGSLDAMLEAETPASST
jgi:D-apiose dehydrogenase